MQIFRKLARTIREMALREVIFWRILSHLEPLWEGRPATSM